MPAFSFPKAPQAIAIQKRDNWGGLQKKVRPSGLSPAYKLLGTAIQQVIF